jgi:hypothetical protein
MEFSLVLVALWYKTRVFTGARAFFPWKYAEWTAARADSLSVRPRATKERHDVGFHPL